MDQLTAYKILGLEPGSSPEEVKEAYAALSKQFHPEEEPEKFQEIHEAYVTLTRRKHRGSVQNTYQEEQIQAPIEHQQTFNFEEIKQEQQMPVEELEQKQEYDFNKVEMEHNVRKAPDYSFEEAMEKAKQEEEAKSHELVLEAAAELKILVSPKYKNQLKAYKSFFEDKKYEPIIRRADFLEKLCDVLEETKLPKNIYNYIIEFYRLRGRKPSELSQIGLRLYEILDEKAGMKQVNPGVYGGVVAGILAGIRAIRPIARNSQIVATIAFCIIAVLLLIWVYKKLKENHSALFVQAIIAMGVALSQFIVIMFDFYGTAFGTVDDGNIVAALIMMAAMAWLAVVSIIAIVKAVIGLIKKN